jgi:hypothetical protein
LLLWLAGWALGEYCGVVALLAQARVLPSPGWAEGPAGSLLFPAAWLIFWPLAGLPAAWQLLRQVWGQDRFELAPGRVEVCKQVGPWRRRSSLAAEEVRQVRLRRPDLALVLEGADGTLVATSLGSLGERRWLRRVLRRHCGLAALDRHDPGTLALERARPPAGWVLEDLPGGLWQLRPGPARRAVMLGALAALALFWGALLAPFLAAAASGSAGLGFWLCFAPFLALGLVLAGGTAHTLLARPGLRLARDLIEVGSWRLRGGGVAVERIRGPEGDECWSLVVGQGERRRVLLRSGRFDEVRDLAGLVALRTGWPLSLPL